MNYAIHLMALLCMACSTPDVKQSSTNPYSDSTAAIDVLMQQQDAWNKGSIDDFMKGYWHSDALKFISKRGIRYGYDSVAASYKRHYNSKSLMGHLTFSNLKVHPLDSSCHLLNVTGQWQITGTDTSGGVFSLIMKPFNGVWVITTDHTW